MKKPFQKSTVEMLRGGISKFRRSPQSSMGVRWNSMRNSSRLAGKQSIDKRKTRIWKVTGGCLAGTVGTVGILGLLLSSDNLRIQLKTWSPEAGLMVEYIGKTVLSMEFGKPEAPKPEAAKPEEAKSEEAKSEAAKPEEAKSEAAKPETAKIEVLQSSPEPLETPQESETPETQVENELQPEQTVLDDQPTDDNLSLVSDEIEDTLETVPDTPQVEVTPLPTQDLEDLEEEEHQKRQADLENWLKVLRTELQLVLDSAATAVVEMESCDPNPTVSSDLSEKTSADTPSDILKEAMVRLQDLQDKLFVIESKKYEKEEIEKELFSLNKQLVSTEALINDLQNELQKSEEQSAVLRMNLDERESYLRANIQLLQEGRDIYNETVSAYAELAEELKQENADLIRGMNKNSEQRIRELEILSTEIKAMENILAWYGQSRTRDQKAVLMSLGVMQLEEHLRNGSSFSRELKFIERVSGEDTVISAVCGAVPADLRRTGVATRSQLLQKWDNVERSARQAAISPQPATSLWDPIFAKIFSWFLLPQRSDQIGDDEQAIISRAGFYLEHGDLRRAVDEVSLLEGLARKVVTDWLRLARDRLLASEVIGLIRVDLVRRHMES